MLTSLGNYRINRIQMGSILQNVPRQWNVYRLSDNRYIGKLYQHLTTKEAWLNVRVGESSYELFTNQRYKSVRALLTALNVEGVSDEQPQPQQLKFPNL